MSGTFVFKSPLPISSDAVIKLLIETKLLIGADGANSRVRKSLNLKQNSDWNKAIAIRAYIDSSNYIEIF